MSAPMNGLEPELMPVFGRFEKDLEVAVGPLPEGAGCPDATPGIEHLPELDNESIPLRIGQVPMERDSMSNAEGEPEKCLRPHRRSVDGLGSPSDCFRRKTYFAANCLKLNEGEPSGGPALDVLRVGEGGGGPEDRRDFSLGVPSFGHGRKIAGPCGEGKYRRRSLEK